MSFPGLVSPVPSGARFLRIDQGVDYDSPGPCVAVGPGKIVRVSPVGSFRGGTGQAVYLLLDHPVTVNGRTYGEIYYAERAPLVSLGQLVGAGHPVMASGTNELGFARNSSPACALVGGFGAGTQPTVCGRDFYAFVQSLVLGVGAPPPPPPPVAHPPPPKPKQVAIAPHAHRAFHRLQLALLVDLPKQLNETARIRHAIRRLSR